MNEDPIHRALKQVVRTDTDPRIVVLVANGLIELMMNTIIEELCKHGKEISKDTRGYPYSIKLLILHEKGILHDDLFEILNRLRRLRNDAAHQPFFKVDHNRVKNIAEPFEKNFPKGSEWSISENIHSLCAAIINSVWANYEGILAPIFAPSIHKITKGSQ